MDQKNRRLSDTFFHVGLHHIFFVIFNWPALESNFLTAFPDRWFMTQTLFSLSFFLTVPSLTVNIEKALNIEMVYVLSMVLSGNVK